MIDTISRVEAWLAVASHRAINRAEGQDLANQDAVQEVVDERRRAAEDRHVLVNLPLDIVLAKQAREYAALTASAAIVDRWSAQLLNPPEHVCRCRHDLPQPPASKLQQLETRVVNQLLNTYRTITRTNTGRLIDVVV